jgi:hypothetical protein
MCGSIWMPRWNKINRFYNNNNICECIRLIVQNVPSCPHPPFIASFFLFSSKVIDANTAAHSFHIAVSKLRVEDDPIKRWAPFTHMRASGIEANIVDRNMRIRTDGIGRRTKQVWACGTCKAIDLNNRVSVASNATQRFSFARSCW